MWRLLARCLPVQGPLTPKGPANVLLAIMAAGTLLSGAGGLGARASGQDAENQPPTPSPTPQVRCEVSTARFSFRGWRTNFLRCSVPLYEFRPVGAERDGIPPVDRPKLETVADADTWLNEREPVIVVEMLGDVRAYPLQIMLWHEIVNDFVGGIPIAVTFSALTHTAIAFERQIQGLTFDFGSTGTLRRSNLVMWDRQTESWWHQATGEAVVGRLTGTRLLTVPASIVSWSDFRGQWPNGQVLSRDTGHSRDYGRNPYVGYDEANQKPFRFDMPVDSRLPPMERVVTMAIGGETIAYPFRALREHRVIAEWVGGQPIVLFFDARTRSALDRADIVGSREVGSSGVFFPGLDGQLLTFTWDGTAFVDLETGSTWTILGHAISGQLAGARLRPVQHADPFWFAAAAFFPDIRVWAPSADQGASAP